MSDLNKLLDTLTQGEQRDLLGMLLKLSCGAVPVDIPPYNWAAVIASAEPIQPDCTTTLSVSAQILWDVKRFVIVPVTTWRTEYTVEERFADRTVGRWRKKTERVVCERITTPVKTLRVVLPEDWGVRGVFVGCKLVFPSHPTIPGEMFAAGGNLGIDMECEPAIGLHVSVHNKGPDPSYFVGVFLGNSKDARVLKAV